MRFGVCLPNFPFGIPPMRDAILEVARSAERLGYDSVWATDHVLVPKDKPRYARVFEAITTLAYVGGATRRVRLGASVLILAQRNAIVVAKQIASLDALTEGRVILGIGAGWMDGEFAALGADFHRRGRNTDEGIRAMKVLWRDADPVFDGAFYRFRDVVCDPKPAQPGGPPVWIGGNSEAALRRAATVADGWHADDAPIDQLKAKGDSVRAQAKAAGRSVEVSLRRTVDMRSAAAAAGRLPGPAQGGSPAGRWPGASAGALAGSVDEVRSEVAQAAQAGVTHFICQFEHASQREHLVSLELFAEGILAQP